MTTTPCAAFSRYFIMSRSCFCICVSIEAYQVLPGDVYYLIYLLYLQYLPTLAAAACGEWLPSCCCGQRLILRYTLIEGTYSAPALRRPPARQSTLSILPSSHTTQPCNRLPGDIFPLHNGTNCAYKRVII